MVRSLAGIAFGLLITTAAHAEPPGRAAATEQAPESELSCTAPAMAELAEPDAEERAFSAELERFILRKSFTERLVAQRTAELFEQAIARQARVAKLQRELAERERARSERELEAAVALHLKKLELTRQRAAAGSGKGVVSPSGGPASSPSL
jgi:hypothetical protein